MKQLLGPGTRLPSSGIPRFLSRIVECANGACGPGTAITAARMGKLAALFALVAVFGAALPGGPYAHGQSPKRQDSGKEQSKNPPTSGQRGVVDAEASIQSSDFSPGAYYALVIGNDNYTYLPKLRTAENDAVALAQLLQDNYGFQTTLLRNATRDDILTALAQYRQTLKGSSNLLIVFSGHGYNDRDAGEAYWLPIDAQNNNNENWISADDITRDVRAIAALHVLIISDSCYSGDLTRAPTNINLGEPSAVLAKAIKSKSRTLMSSGGDEPVADGGAGDHSVFAGAVLASLQMMTDAQFTANSLFENVQQQVAAKSAQTPQYNLMQNTGHEWGDFVFSRKGAKLLPAPVDLPPPVIPTAGGDVEAINQAVRQYQDAFNQLNAGALWGIWPSASARTKRKIEDSFASASSIQMSIQTRTPEIAADGKDAKVRGSFTQTFTPKNSKPQPEVHGDIGFVLKKANDKWAIVDTN